MFKKSKKDKTTPPPTLPTAEEILDDLETFNVMPVNTPAPTDESKHNSTALSAWWAQFEKFTENLEDLIVVRDLVNTYKLKLESSKIELQTQAKLFSADIEEQKIFAQQALQ